MSTALGLGLGLAHGPKSTAPAVGPAVTITDLAPADSNVYESSLAAGSDPGVANLVITGILTVDYGVPGENATTPLTVNGVEITAVAGGTVIGVGGDLVLAAASPTTPRTHAFTYTLDKAVTNVNNSIFVDAFIVVATDTTPDSTTRSINAMVNDDSPTAGYMDQNSAGASPQTPIDVGGVQTFDPFLDDQYLPSADIVPAQEDINDGAGGVSVVSQPTKGTVAVIALGVLEYTNDDVNDGMDSFTYQLRDGDGSVSVSTVDVTISNILTDVPANVVLVKDNSREATLTWTYAGSDADAYEVHIREIGQGSWETSQQVSDPTLTYTFTGLKAGTEYEAEVRALDTSPPLGSSNWVAAAATATTDVVPNVANLSAALPGTAFDYMRINVDYDTFDNSASEISHIYIERSVDDAAWSPLVTILPTVTTTPKYVDDNLPAGQIYYYRTRTKNSLNQYSAYSSSVTATTATIVAPVLNGNYDDVNTIALTWNDTSGGTASNFRLFDAASPGSPIYQGFNGAYNVTGVSPDSGDKTYYVIMDLPNAESYQSNDAVVSTASGPSVPVSRAEELLSGETNGLSIAFIDDSMLVNDGGAGTVTDILGGGVTRPINSGKIIRGANGLLGYQAHNFMPATNGIGSAPWSSLAGGVVVSGDTGAAEGAEITCAARYDGIQINTWLTDTVETVIIMDVKASKPVTWSGQQSNGNFLFNFSVTTEWQTFETPPGLRTSTSGFFMRTSGASDGGSTVQIRNLREVLVGQDRGYIENTGVGGRGQEDLWGLPFDHDLEGFPLGVLNEPAATNVMLNSQDLTGRSVNDYVITRDGVGPDGVQDSPSRCTLSNTTASHWGTMQNIPLTNDGTAIMLVSAIMRDNLDGTQTFPILSHNGTTCQFVVDLRLGLISAQASGDFTLIDSGIEDLGNGWWRPWLTFTSTHANAQAGLILQWNNVYENATFKVFNGTGHSTIDVWNIDCYDNTQPVPTSPIITGIAEETRDPDSIILLDANFTTPAWLPLAVDSPCSYYQAHRSGPHLGPFESNIYAWWFSGDTLTAFQDRNARVQGNSLGGVGAQGMSYYGAADQLNADGSTKGLSKIAATFTNGVVGVLSAADGVTGGASTTFTWLTDTVRWGFAGSYSGVAPIQVSHLTEISIVPVLKDQAWCDTITGDGPDPVSDLDGVAT